jgi:hypothetical protein
MSLILRGLLIFIFVQKVCQQPFTAWSPNPGPLNELTPHERLPDAAPRPRQLATFVHILCI